MRGLSRPFSRWALASVLVLTFAGMAGATHQAGDNGEPDTHGAACRNILGQSGSYEGTFEVNPVTGEPIRDPVTGKKVPKSGDRVAWGAVYGAPTCEQVTYTLYVRYLREKEDGTREQVTLVSAQRGNGLAELTWVVDTPNSAKDPSTGTPGTFTACAYSTTSNPGGVFDRGPNEDCGTIAVGDVPPGKSWG